MLKMIHEGIDSVAEVVDLRTFHAVWAPRDWTLLPNAEAFATDVLGQNVKALEDLKVTELRALVSARGLEYPGKELKADVVKILRDQFADSEAAADENPDEVPTEVVAADGGTPDPVVAEPTTDKTKDKR